MDYILSKVLSQHSPPIHKNSKLLVAVLFRGYVEKILSKVRSIFDTTIQILGFFDDFQEILVKPRWLVSVNIMSAFVSVPSFFFGMEAPVSLVVYVYDVPPLLSLAFLQVAQCCRLYPVVFFQNV